MFKLIICLFITILHVKSIYGQCQTPMTTASGHAALPFHCVGDLIFEDNFDWLDTNKWQHEVSLYGGFNGEFQWYVNDRQNTFTTNSQLHIRPSLTSDYLGGEDKLYSATIDLGASCTEAGDWGCKRVGTATDILNPIRSGRLNTKNSFAFKYGKVEIRAKMPAGDWLWPALWFLPRDSKYGQWPRSGEIDLMESRGNRNYQSGGKNIGSSLAQSTLHWGPDAEHNAFMKTHYERYEPSRPFNSEFRNYQVTWTPWYIQFSIDGQVVGTADPGTNFYDFGGFAQQGFQNPWAGGAKAAPFDQEFFIILNLAIGGTSGFFPDEAQNYPSPKPWADWAPHAMTDFWRKKNEWFPTWKLWENNGDEASLKIDYVRIWAI